MVRPVRLTKSRFKLGCECPTKLFYSADPRRFVDTNRADPFLASLAEGGYQVGELAKLMHPGGVEVTTLNEARALDETTRLLDRDPVVVFEGAFAAPDANALVRVDVLERIGGCVYLREVKAKSFDPGEDSFWGVKKRRLVADWLPYLLDIAFQTWVVEQALPWARVSPRLVLADKRALASVDGVHQRFLARRVVDPDSGRSRLQCDVAPGTTRADLGSPLLVEIPVEREVAYLRTEWRDSRDQSFTELIERFGVACRDGRRFEPTLTSSCKRCEFRPDPTQLDPEQQSGFLECWSEARGLPVERLAAEPLVVDLWQARKTEQWLASGATFLRDLDEQDVGVRGATDENAVGLSRSARQWLQVVKAKERDDSPFVDVDGLRAELGKLVWPLHFLDFETARVAIPFHAGTRPYAQHAFQFSHHVMYEDGRLEHRASAAP